MLPTRRRACIEIYDIEHKNERGERLKIKLCNIARKADDSGLWAWWSFVSSQIAEMLPVENARFNLLMQDPTKKKVWSRLHSYCLGFQFHNTYRVFSFDASVASKTVTP